MNKRKKNWWVYLMAASLIFGSAACSTSGSTTSSVTTSNVTTSNVTANATATASKTTYSDATQIVLSDSKVTVNGETASTDSSAAVYTGAEIIYYHDGQDSSYGDGSDEDAHTAQEAAANTVVTITQPGTYVLSGTLSAGQIAVDLGEDASTDPDAVVTLVLNGVDITCTVAPAVIFYNVYECGSTDTDKASATVDTSAAGANVILADGSKNVVNGAYVAKIYKEGTTKKLYKFDGAFYSKMSMNISSDGAGTGSLSITGTNEGLDSELHLTINSGNISITSQDDGINTNEDSVSVTTINGGNITINAGLGSEGDGIDSNGYLVINGGTVYSMANPTSGDGGVDSDCGIYLNGGTVVAFGNRSDEIESESKQVFTDLKFAQTQSKGAVLKVTDENGNIVYEMTAQKDFTDVVISLPELTENSTYHVYVNDVLQQYNGTGGQGGFGGGMPGGMNGQAPADGTAPQMPSDGTVPGNGTAPSAPADGQAPSGDRPDPSAGAQGKQRPDGAQGTMPGGHGNMGDSATATGESSTDFVITSDTHVFNNISAAQDSTASSNS